MHVCARSNGGENIFSISPHNVYKIQVWYEHGHYNAKSGFQVWETTPATRAKFKLVWKKSSTAFSNVFHSEKNKTVYFFTNLWFKN